MGNSFLMPPNLAVVKRALFVQPHPDDNEMGAGGLMARLCAEGCEVYALTVTDGRYGNDNTPHRGDALAEARKQEALCAMQVLGANNAGFLGFSDKTAATEAEIAAEIQRVMETLRPDAVFTVDPNLPLEWHPDHRKTGNALALALQDAGNPVACIGYYFTSDPNTDCDISAYYEKKMQAIACHKTQVTPEFRVLLEDYYGEISKQTVFAHAERLKLFAPLHTHCWTLPLEKVVY